MQKRICISGGTKYYKGEKKMSKKEVLLTYEGLNLRTVGS